MLAPLERLSSPVGTGVRGRASFGDIGERRVSHRASSLTHVDGRRARTHERARFQFILSPVSPHPRACYGGGDAADPREPEPRGAE